MKIYKFLWFLGVLLIFRLAGLSGELVIEREAMAPPVKGERKGWKKIDGTEMFVASFAVPPDLPSHGPPRAAEDPFDDGGQSDRELVFKEIFESVGIPFPEGATAVYNPARSEIIVRNRWENLELIEAYLEDAYIDTPPPTLSIRTEIYELTTLQALELQESADGEIDHKPERDAALRAVRGGGARLVATHSTLTTPGQRTKVEDLVSLMVPEIVRKEGAAPQEKLVPLYHGTTLEAEPNLDADGVTVSLNIAFEHHTAEPELVTLAGKGELPRLHDKSVQTNLRLFSGDYILLASWRPTGRPEYADSDLTQVVFVTVSVQGGE